jgi:feruloyl esterase
MRGGKGVVIDWNDDPARQVPRRLRPRRSVLRALPHFILLVALATVSSWSAAVVDGSTAGAATAATPVILPIRPCGDLTSERLLSSAGVRVRFFSARLSDFTGAEYCHVIGEIGTDFYFDLRLPRSTYQGQYVQEGCGGFCGFLSPYVPLAADHCPAVTGNTLALAVDNEGHVTTSNTDARWAANDAKSRLIFGSTSEHQLALVAKTLIADYYGRGPDYSYFDGCSDGGREALIEAQRYPHDFNGILAGAPANIQSELLGEVASWNIRVNTGPGGREILTSEKLPALHAAVVRACGQGRGYVLDPRTCNFSPSSIECHGRSTNSCLTAAQVRVVVSLYRGPTDPAGQSLYPGGEPYGSELGWSAWFVKPSGDQDWPQDTLTYRFAINFLRYLAYRTDPPSSYSLSQFRFSYSSYQKLTALSELYDATDPDLSSFAADGGRLMIYQGWADEAIPPFGTVAYYKAVVDAAGGYQASQAFSRLYMIPAQYHCLAGGDPALAGADLLTPLIDWVQHGAPPGALSFNLASKKTPRNRTTGGGSLSVAPLDPLASLPSGSNGLNANYDWVGSFGSNESA